MKMRILFVDDQPNVLAGLRRMLRSLRNEWDMEFAESGSIALEKMKETSFDVVVSDMRMPGMDGSQLLTETMKRYPATVRIILSGEADQKSVLQAVAPAHQYLSKPCDAETVKSTISRACSFRDKLSHASIISLVSQVTTLPCVPHVYARLMNELQQNDPSLKRIADLIAQDIGMTAKIMQLVNSSFFGTPRHIESPAHAASLLGLNVIKQLVFSAGIFAPYQKEGLQGFSIDTLTEHSLAISHVAEEIAKSYSQQKELADHSQIAGLLHDIGQLLLIENWQDRYDKTVSLARNKKISLCAAEQECLGASHADIGAYLLGLWGLPDPIVEAIAWHHQPAKSHPATFSPLTAVHVANVFINELMPLSNYAETLQMDIGYLEKIGVADQLPLWRAIAVNACSERGALA